MDIADDDIELESRVSDLIERGLERYGTGDMEGALSLWKHALALDPDSERAANYLHYVEDHHDLAGDDEKRFTESTVELAYPFGVADLGLGKLRDEDLDDYESIEIVGDGEPGDGEPGDGDITKTVTKAIASLDDGWSVDEGWAEDLVKQSELVFTPAPLEERPEKASPPVGKPTRRAPTSEASFADLELDSAGDEDLEPTRARIGHRLVEGEIDQLDVALSTSDEATTMALRSPSQGLNDDQFELAELGLGNNPGAQEELTMPGGAEPAPEAGLGPHAMAAIKQSSQSSFDSRDESTAERSGARARGFDELELEPLESRSLPGIPDAIDHTDAGLAISFDDDESSERTMDEELTIDRSSLSSAGLDISDISRDSDAPGESSESSRELALPPLESAADTAGTPAMEISDYGSGGTDIGLSGDEPASLNIGSPPTGDILAEVCSAAPKGDEGERTTFIVGRLIDIAGEEYTEGNNEKAAVAISHALDRADDSALAQKVIFENERRIVEILIASLGELEDIPRLLIPLSEIPLGQINHRAAFLLTRADGTLTLDEILDVSGMPRMEALRHLHGLHAKHFLEVS